jgi:hypothetical protein
MPVVSGKDHARIRSVPMSKPYPSSCASRDPPSPRYDASWWSTRVFCSNWASARGSISRCPLALMSNVSCLVIAGYATRPQTLAPCLLQDLLHGTVHALQAEIPGLGETIAIDVLHIYAWVRANNLRDDVPERYNPACQPIADPDCRLGVKRPTNQEQLAGSSFYHLRLPHCSIAS